MFSLGQDLRYAIRILRQSPGFTAMAVLSLGLGIGANTALFTLVNAALFRPPEGVSGPDRLVGVGARAAGSSNSFGNVSYPDYRDIRDQTHGVFSALSCWTFAPVDTRLGDTPVRLGGMAVSDNFFDVMGSAPAIGRAFDATDADAGSPAAVISYRLWQTRFGGATSVLGRQIVLNAKPYQIVGVAAKDFHGLQPIAVDVWMLVGTQPSEALENRGMSYLHITGRLRDGVTAAQARARVEVIGRNLAKAYPDSWTGFGGRQRTMAVLPAMEAVRPPGPIVLFLAVLMSVVGLVLVIACSNIANLLLARAESRRKEIAIRLSLGAGRARVLRQLLTENLVISLAGGALALLLAGWTADVLMRFKPPSDVPILVDLAVDHRVFAFNLGTALLTSILFGLAPALAATRPDVVPALKNSAAGLTSGSGRFGLRNLLIGGQAAVSMLLLISAGLFVRSLWNANSIDPGFNTRNIVTVEANMGLRGLSDSQARLAHQRLVAAVRTVPGVRDVSMTRLVPLSLNDAATTLAIEGRPADERAPLLSSLGWVGPRYFETMDVPVLAGRGFTEADREGSPLVVVVNEAFASRFWPGESALGKRVSLETKKPVWREVVGVVKTGKYVTLGEEPTPFLYVPYEQGFSAGMNLVIRTEQPAAAALGAVRAALHRADPDLPLDGLMTMEESLGAVLLPARLAGSVLGLFGLLALLLAAVGLYGVMSYLVARRTREMGIRMALGARPADLLAMVMRRGLGVAFAGMLIGVVMALGLTRFAASLLYGISPMDPVTYGGVFALVGVVAAAACFLPARRAARVEPLTALRFE